MAKTKKKKKKFLPALLILLVIGVVAVNGGSDDKVKQPSSVEGDDSTAKKDTAKASDEVTVEEAELYNENGISVTVTGMKDSLFGPEISVTVANDTEQNVTVSTQLLSVNGYMLSTSGLYCDVAAGKKAADSISLMSSELDEAGIETIAALEFYLSIYDSDSYDTIAKSELITVNTSAAEGFTQEVDDSGDVIYDANGVRVICKGLKDEVIWDGCVVFLMENTSGKTLTVCGENVSVNGYMVDESLWSELRDNTRSVVGMYLLTLEEIGLESIEEVEDIEFSLRVIDEDWNTVAESDAIVLNFTEE